MAGRRGRDQDGGRLLRLFVRDTDVWGVLIAAEGVNYCTLFGRSQTTKIT
jgi:hypothetical protein